MALNFPDSPSLNQVYTSNGVSWFWDGTAWIKNLNSISDVVVTSVAAGDFLKHDGSNWINDPINLATDTVGSYVESLVAGTGITIDNNSGEAATPNISIDTATIATRSYVDAVAVGLYWHEAVNLATAGVLPNSPNYSNGTSGVGATLAATTNGRLIVDGANASNGNRILVKNQSDAKQNGIYVVTTQGTVSTTWLLTRAEDSNNSPLGEFKTGDAVYALSGSVNSRQGFVVTSFGSLSGNVVDIGTDEVTYTQFSGTASFTAGSGLVADGNTLNVATANNNRIVVNSDDIDLATVTQSNTSGSATTSFISAITVDSYGRVSGKETSSIDFSSSIQKSLVDAKGDLIVGSADDAVARLQVGSNGYFLKANSSATYGIEWASIPTINYLDDVGDVTITSASSGQFLKWNGSAWINDVIDLGTDTDGNYVSNATAGTGISVSHTPGEGSTVTISLNATLDDLSNVTVPSPSSGDFLKWNGSAWVNDAIDLGTDTTGNYMSGVSAGTGINVSHTPSEGSTATVSLNATLDNLSNVTVPTPSNGQFLKYVSAASEWQASNIASIDDITDVIITSAASGDFLKWNGSAWINDPIDLATDTTGSYVQSLVAGTGITLTNNSGESSTPTVAVDTSVIATRTYVDGVAQGLHVHAPAKVATTGTLASITGGTVTYNNGTNGVGATLTLSVALTTLDGYSLQNGDRILVKNQATQAHNGIYTWATGGTVLTRATDFDTPTEAAGGDFLFVTDGTVYGDTGWVETEAVTTFGTTNIIFLQFSGAGTYTAGTGLTLNGTAFSVNASQTQITALGTIATGTWNATVIGSTYGGTGINNGGRTITLNTGNVTITADAAGSSITLPASGTVATLSGTETLSGKTLSSVILGTPASGTLTNCTGLPVATGISGLGSGIATFLATPSSANLISAVTDETGTGSLVFGTSPTIATPTLTLSSTTSTTSGRIAWDATANKLIIGDGTKGVEIASSARLTNVQTASYTLVAADKDKIVEMNVTTTANTVTIPLNSSVPYHVGTEIIVLQVGTGQTTIAGAGGVTVNGTPGLKLRAQWSAVTLIKRATDTWVVIGDLSA